MNKMKYIVINNSGFEEPVMFGETMTHSDVALALAGFDATNIVSAGFVVGNSEGLTCYGRSVSLDKDSRPEEDTKLINRMLGYSND